MGFGIIGKEQVVERWDTLIAGADGKGQSILDDTKRFLEESKVPDAKIQNKSMSPGVMQGILGGKRPFIVVSNTSNSNLKPYKMFINTRDYGVNLQISWFLVHQPGLWDKIAGYLMSIPLIGLLVLPAYSASKFASSREAGILGLNLFDEQDLRAYVSNAHNCLIRSVDQLNEIPKFEMPVMNKNSQGFLGIV